MPEQETELSDIVVVMEDDSSNSSALVKLLKDAGVDVDQVDEENGVVEGTILTSKLKAIGSIPGVKYVRNVFTYIAEEGGDEQDEHVPR
jgi:4-hydroxy-3-methylbut-2-enyl diphosphate reductase IspH